MPPLAYFGIESSGLSLAVDLLILFLVVLYFSLIYWTYADARRRIADPVLIGCATAASLFPFVGTIVYMILRPPEYLEDVRERELELQAAEARLHAARPGPVPALRLPHRARLRALPQLSAQAQGALRQLLPAARPGVDDLPLLRGRRARASPRRACAGAAARGRSRRSCRPPHRAAAGRRGADAAERRADERRRHRRRRRHRPPSGAPSGGRPNAGAAGAARSRCRAPRPRPVEPAGRHRPPSRSAKERAANADPRQARRLRPLAHGRDHRPLRAQGPAHRRRCAT